VNEESRCNWDYVPNGIYDSFYKSSCGREIEFSMEYMYWNSSKRYIYCPYCGGKIRKIYHLGELIKYDLRNIGYKEKWYQALPVDEKKQERERIRNSFIEHFSIDGKDNVLVGE